MAERNRGFDPLASLFEAPDPARPAAAMLDEDEVFEPVPDQSPAVVTAPPMSTPAPPPDPAAVTLPAAPPVDKEAIAKAVAAAATARLGAARPPAPPPAAPAVDKEAIAKAVAAAATARLGVAAKAAPKAAAPPAPAPQAAPARPASRLDSMARRAVRPRNALEAARAAAAAEATTAVETAEARPLALRSQLTHRVRAMIPRWLPNAGRVLVEQAMIADERETLTALWRGHRARFLRDGELERAVGAAAVLHALATVGAGRLVAAHMLTDASDFLVWIDLDIESGEGNLLAAFSNARAYFSGR